MKHIATMALMRNLGVAAIYAQQKPVTMTFSGTVAPSAIELKQSDTNNSEGDFAGDGTLGPYSFRHVRAITASPQPSSSCSSSTQLSFSNVTGAGVFRLLEGCVGHPYMGRDGGAVAGRCL